MTKHVLQPEIIVSNQRISVRIYFKNEQINRIELCDHPQTEQFSQRFPLVFTAFHTYLEGKTILPDFPVEDSQLTTFQKMVYKELRMIPAGENLTYKELAMKLNLPHHARAVARALGANPFPLLYPCHRVVAAHGIGGYSAPGGAATKLYLLDLEKRNNHHGR